MLVPRNTPRDSRFRPLHLVGGTTGDLGVSTSCYPWRVLIRFRVEWTHEFKRDKWSGFFYCKIELSVKCLGNVWKILIKISDKRYRNRVRRFLWGGYNEYFQNFVGTTRSFSLTTLPPHRYRYELDSPRLQIFLSKRIQSFRDDRVTLRSPLESLARGEFSKS